MTDWVKVDDTDALFATGTERSSVVGAVGNCSPDWQAVRNHRLSTVAGAVPHRSRPLGERSIGFLPWSPSAVSETLRQI